MLLTRNFLKKSVLNNSIYFPTKISFWENKISKYYNIKMSNIKNTYSYIKAVTRTNTKETFWVERVVWAIIKSSKYRLNKSWQGYKTFTITY